MKSTKPGNQLRTIAQKEPVALTLGPGEYQWCACGLSGNQPWCDGSHQGTGFTPRRLIIKRRETVWLCTCKQSRRGPRCDGSHNRL